MERIKCHICKREAKERRKYFLKQKLLGVLLIALGLVTLSFSEGDATVFVTLLLFALCFIFSKRMLLTNSYYYEHGGEEELFS